MTNLGSALWLLIKLEPGATFQPHQMIQLLQQAHPQFALTQFALLSEQVHALFLPKTLMLLGAISLALFTMLLSGIGLIGVMQYNLQLRQIEFSIKLALGAEFSHILRESGSEYLRLLAGAVLISGLLLGAGYLMMQRQPQWWPSLDGITLYSLALDGFK